MPRRARSRPVQWPQPCALLFALFAGPLAQPELLHFELKSLARNLEKPRRVGDVAGGLLKGATHELSLEPTHGHLDVLLEPALAGQRSLQVGLRRRDARESRDAA